MRRLVTFIVIAAALIAGTVSLASARSHRQRASAHPQRVGHGQFATPCRYSHSLPDDPIVFPGKPGASHLHDFFGNVSTSASSTRASMLRAGTTCRRAEDRAGYWVPALYLNGQPVTPLRAQIYYTTGGKRPASVRAFPAGLKVIAGSSTATAPQDPRVTSWHCGPNSGIRFQTEVPTCPTGDRLRLQVRFPDCWNGRNTDLPGHKVHMAYSVRGRCPSGYPVAVPRIILNVVYPFAGGPGVTFSSGSRYTAHADFFNAWDQRALTRLVQRCLNAARVCHAR
ncbi:MAG: hypothetical protein QOK04_2681 [Solirubrobacteraceae bacterium]|jgi:hypothetical protein|nr:hypothetical protein [Solirubrobacteraceae bacterium]